MLSVVCRCLCYRVGPAFVGVDLSAGNVYFAGRNAGCKLWKGVKMGHKYTLGTVDPGGILVIICDVIKMPQCQ